ncbi:hypothetical protein HDU97_009801 [Phlyctochytrium planicorne]|nr:hypothetical protein HDU97_009801 [Phlyctochytrium planicorne]
MFGTIPLEILQPILLLTGDAGLAIKVESILLGLPHRHAAKDSYNIYDGRNLSNFPISSKLTKRQDWKPFSSSLSLCQVHWIIKFRPHILMWNNGALWNQIADQNSFRMFKALHRAKVDEGFPLYLMDKAVENGNMEAGSIDLAARNSHSEVIQDLHQHKWMRIHSSCLEGAAASGNMDLVKYLARYTKITAECIAAAAEEGRLDVIKFLFKKMRGAKYVVQMAARGGVAKAARNGHIDVVKFLIKKFPGQFYYTEAGVEAIKGGHVEILRLFRKQSPIQHASSVVDAALARGDLRILRILTSKTLYTNESIKDIASEGHLDIIQYLVEDLKLPHSALSFAMMSAAANGHLHIVKYLHNLGCRSEPVLLADVVKTGNLELVEFVHNHCRVNCTAETMDAAAGKGFLDIIRFLHTHRTEGCTRYALALAAANGHFDVVKWFHENKTEQEFTHVVLNKAAANGHLEIVKFLHFHRSEGCTTEGMDKAAANGHLEVVKFLHFHRSEGCTVAAMDDAAALEDPSILKFLYENRTEGCSGGAMDGAAAVGLIGNVKFLHEQRGTACTSRAMLAAAANGHLEVVEYVHRHCKDKIVLEDRDISRVLSQGYIDIVRYFLEHGLTDDSVFALFAREGYLKEIKSGGFDRLMLHWWMEELLKVHTPAAIEAMLGVRVPCLTILSLSTKTK